MADGAAGAGLSRRRFLKAGSMALGAAALAPAVLARGGEAPPRKPAGTVTFGVMADVHFADRDPSGTRYYRDSTAKMAEAVRTLNEARPDFAVILGDLVDKGADAAEGTAFLKQIEAVYRQFTGERHHVLGNHDLDNLTKAEFGAETGMPAPHYAFDHGSYHFIVLDGCTRKDGTPYAAGNANWQDSILAPEQLKWLAEDLKRAAGKAVVFVHQRLDDEKSPHAVKNADEVRKVLQACGKVRAVFQGHTHQAAHREVAGIHYVTLRGMIEGPGLENNAYALVRLSADGIEVRGYGRQPSLSLK